MYYNYTPFYGSCVATNPIPVIPIPPATPGMVTTPPEAVTPNMFASPLNPCAPRDDRPHLISEIMSIEHSSACGQLTFALDRIIHAIGIVVDYLDKNKILKTASTIAGTPIRYGYEGDISKLKNAPTALRRLDSVEYRNIVSVTNIRIVHDIPLILDNTINTSYTGTRRPKDLEIYIASCTCNNLSFLFQECDNLKEISACALKDVPAAKADFMFAGCKNLDSDVVFPHSTLMSCIGLFAGCEKMNGNITFNSTPNISGIFYGTSRGWTFDKIRGLDMTILLNNFTHLIQPYTDLMSAHAVKFDPSIRVQRSSGWGEEDTNIFAKPINMFEQSEPDTDPNAFSREQIEAEERYGWNSSDSSSTQEKSSKDNS